MVPQFKINLGLVVEADAEQAMLIAASLLAAVKVPAENVRLSVQADYLGPKQRLARKGRAVYRATKADDEFSRAR